MSRIDVATSDYAIGHSPDTLATAGIGSCVAVCLHHPQRQIGALLHIMLPRAEGDRSNPWRFADTALSFIVVELQRRDVRPHELTAKLVGGAQMFKAFAAHSNIGEHNVIEITHTLQALDVAIANQDIGGNLSRSLEFELATGNVTIFTQDPAVLP